MFRPILILVIVLPVLVSAQGLRSKVNSGNEHYYASEYEQALGSYKDALLDDPLNEKILFNEADALFKMEKYEEAREGYQKLLATKDLDLISSKLDTIKASLDSMNQRIQKIEKIAEASQKEEKKKDPLW